MEAKSKEKLTSNLDHNDDLYTLYFTMANARIGVK